MNFSRGLVSVSFRKNSPEEILEKMKQTGISEIEWGSDVHAPYDDIEKLNNLAALQRSYGITCCSYGTYFRLGVHNVDQLCCYINGAKILGTNILRIWCGDKNSEDYSEEEKLNLIEEGKKAANIAQSHNVILCLECHNNTFTNTLCGALEIMNGVNSPNFKMYWQPNQFKSFEQNCQYARTIAPQTVHIHAFNWDGGNRYPLIEGAKKWKQYLSCFQGEHKLLLEFMPNNTLEELENEALALKKIIEE